MDPITTTISAFASSFVLFSPVERYVHQDLMHVAPKKRSNPHLFQGIRARASEAHQDEHHMAFNAPEHYYRDTTNEHVVVHFAYKDVGYILGSTALVSSAFSAAANSLLSKELSVNPFYVAGSVAASLAYYAAYKFTHHYMHVIGERRHAILTDFGNIVQGGKPDGKLRFSKPLLDDISNEVEDWVDHRLKNNGERRKSFSMPQGLYCQYNDQIQNMPSTVALVDVAKKTPQVFDELADKTFRAEEAKVQSMSNFQLLKYTLDRKLQRSLRRSPTFSALDNHHFIHHAKWAKNLNVVLPLADYVFGSKADSSRATLEKTAAYWLCPNSPDTEKFVLPAQ